MLDKLYKYIEDNNIDLNKISWNDCVNGFLNDVEVKRHKYELDVAGNKRDITGKLVKEKLVNQINKLFRKGDIYLSDRLALFRFKSSVSNTEFDLNKGFHFIHSDSSYLPYELFALEYCIQMTPMSLGLVIDRYTDPIEFLKRFEFICSDPSEICKKAKIYSYNLFHKDDECPAMEINVVNDEPQINLIEPL